MSRWWNKVEIIGACWIWRGSTNGRYGEMRLAKGVKVYAHRWIYEQLWGELAEGLVVMHSCDNTMCVRPAHLSAGTQADNLRDMRAKGRHASQRRKVA